MKSYIKLAAVLGLGCAFAGANAETYAFLMGVKDYPDVVDKDGKPVYDEKGKKVDNDLNGPINDVNSMKDILIKKFNVKADNVKTALDKEAGEKGFVDGMKWLLNTAKEGDQIIFYFSGHGGQLKTTTEEDGIDEVIVLGDNKLVKDDLFADVVKMTSKGGVNATFIFDSCFSGGMSRPAQQGIRKTKALDLNRPGMKANFKPMEASKYSGIKTSFKQSAGSTMKGSYAFLFAGQESQPTIDISGVKDIPDHGVFTLFLTAALEDDSDTTLEDLVKTTETVLKDLEFDQKPMGEFSSSDRSKMPLIFK